MMRIVGKIQGEWGRDRTVQEMVKLIREGTRDPLVIKVSRGVVREYGDRSRFGRAKAIHDWVRSKIHYVNDPRGMEVLRPARKVLLSRIGDCDEHVVLTGAMYRAVGLPFRIMTLSVRPGKPHHHVVGLVRTEYGWNISDTTHPLHTFGDDASYWRMIASHKVYRVD